jgi:response regulator RpfG family c-di-GMP phosphodiesterase
LVKLLKTYIFSYCLSDTLNHSTHSRGKKKKTVMVCDDELDVLQLFGQALKSKFNVILVSSGEHCIEKFIEEKNRGNRIHLLLLDYKLNDMLGDSVARKIKEYNGVKIILISAYDLDSDFVRELKENNYIARYIEKPIHLTNLIDLVTDTIC